MKLLIKLLSISIVFPFILASCATTASDPYQEARHNFEIQDYSTAFTQVQVPANKGNAEAQYALGYMYYYGKGTETNQVLGKKWIARSAAQGYETALQAYQMILAQEQSGVILTSDQTAASTVSAVTPTITIPSVTPAPTASMAKLPMKKLVSSTYSADEKIILAMPKNHFAIQLTNTNSANSADAFIEQHHLTTTAHYFRHNSNGNVIYVVIEGNYSTRSAVMAAIKKLSKPLQHAQPWPRRYADIHTLIHMH